MNDEIAKGMVRFSSAHCSGFGCMIAGSRLIVAPLRLVEGQSEVWVNAIGLGPAPCSVRVEDAWLDVALFEKPPTIADHVGLNFSKDAIGLKSRLQMVDCSSQTEPQMVWIENVENKPVHPTFRVSGTQAMPACGIIADQNGRVAGLQVRTVPGGHEMAEIVPASLLNELITEYRQSGKEQGIRCMSCFERIWSDTLGEEICQWCASEIQWPSEFQPVAHGGIPATIEQLLSAMGYDPIASRHGPDSWHIRRGSAFLHLSYHAQSGLITCEAALCKIGPETNPELFRWMLVRNHSLERMSLSVQDSEVFLTTLLYDHSFSPLTAGPLFEQIFSQADSIDNVLVEKFGAEWIQ